ncbi:radical SAM protein [candidate division KSB1 bacterium]|nr:radical SAM protein [candidate division KSB1 bacterium]
MSVSRKKLNKNLSIFFRDAVRVAIGNPRQALSFTRTLFWLAKAARIRARIKHEGVDVPPIIIFSITNQCNLNCQGCYNQSFHHRDGAELSDNHLQRIVQEANTLGVSFFVIAGGEPFMRPVFVDIMKKYPQMIFLVFTNGLLIDETLLETFCRHSNIVPLISLEGTDGDTDRRRGKGTAEHLTSVMRTMKSHNQFFGNSLTLTRQNFSTIMDELYIRNLVENGCKFFLFLEYTPIAEGTKDWVLTDDQRIEMIKLLNRYRSTYPALFIGVPWDEDDVGGCLSAGRGFIHINAAGDVEPCPFAPFSDVNLRDTSLKIALKSSFLKAIRDVPELAKENGEGCILWKERERVKALLETASATESGMV